MKVAILTQPLQTNYGGTLQAYALQKVVAKMGGEVTTINYQCKQRNLIRFILAVLKSHIANRDEKFPFLSKELKVRERYHREFIEREIKRSEIILSEEDLIEHFHKVNYDTVIVGSDQVWRIEYSPNIDNFFLNFVDKSTKKIAYAASFGVDNWQFSPKKTQKIKKWLKEFNAISVREDSASNLCKEYLELEAKHVLDPTLLLKKEDYMNLIEKFPKINKNIFTYILDDSDTKKEVISHISSKLGLTTFKKQPEKIYKTELFVKNNDEYIYPKIEEWICSFRDASFIITDSFHGTVFSIIFNKPFVVIANSERGLARFTSLLKLFDLESRMIVNCDQLNDFLIYDDIDFERINEKLEKLRFDSIKFIESNLFL